jgi:DNA-binding GntR family transcriptional regulator
MQIVAADVYAYQGIKELLFKRRLAPGQKLIYRDLEQILGVSKTPIINALARLERENMVVSRHNFGYYVKQWSPKEIEQMFELKEKTHQILVNYAIENHTPEAIASLKQALDDYLNYRCEVYNVEKFRLDMNFHITFSSIVGNDYLTSVLSQQYSIMSYVVDLAGLTPLMPQFEEDHKSIYYAIVERDVVMAKKILRLHDRRGAKNAVRLVKAKYGAE